MMGYFNVKINKGFTLIEILVVMVIMSLTTSLLISGLTTTWSNFERLNSRQLKINGLELPKLWFNNSYAAALHSHPSKVTLNGNEESVSFTTFSVPNETLGKPRKITWSINKKQEEYSLGFSTSKSARIDIVNTSAPMKFEYLHNGSWQNTFSTAGILPKAIRVVLPQSKIWTTANLKRDVNAYHPPELELFGAYEY